MVEVPNPIFGRNIHNQQIQFYRADIIGGMTGNVYIGRISRGTILINGLILVEEVFSEGTLSIMYGTNTIVSDVSLTELGSTTIDFSLLSPADPPITRTQYLSGCFPEIDLYAIINGNTNEDSGVCVMYVSGVEPRISNEIYTQFPFSDTSRMVSKK